MHSPRWYDCRAARNARRAAEAVAREAARQALLELYIRVPRQLDVARRWEWARAASLALPPDILQHILELAD